MTDYRQKCLTGILMFFLRTALPCSSLATVDTANSNRHTGSQRLVQGWAALFDCPSCSYFFFPGFGNGNGLGAPPGEVEGTGGCAGGRWEECHWKAEGLGGQTAGTMSGVWVTWSPGQVVTHRNWTFSGLANVPFWKLCLP